MEQKKDRRICQEHAHLLCSSYKKWINNDLICLNKDDDLAFALYHAPFILVSHGTEQDPILNYGNNAALNLWELKWEDFIRTPSHKTAEPIERVERERFLGNVAKNGYVDDYSGIRISSSGRRFIIHQATVWNLVDDDGIYHGQAATFKNFSYV